jgi:hypothetical protein
MNLPTIMLRADDAAASVPSTLLPTDDDGGCHDGCAQQAGRQKRPRDEMARVAQKSPRSLQRVVCSSSVCSAAEALLAPDSLATLVKRSLPKLVADAFSSYVASQPRWPDTHELHPMESTHDRVAVIEFSHEEGRRTLDAATGYGRNLPPRHSPRVASARVAIAQVLCVLPDECAAAAARDASDLLEALRLHTGWRQYIVRLELVRGDTCQKWHRDLNVCRSIVTYVGPGTLVAHEDGVARAADGSVKSADAQRVVQLAAGDVLLMKGGLWRDGAHGGGAAHRAPTIGPVPTAAHRLMLKVDVSENF